MTSETPLLKSWQFFAACLKILGKARMYTVFRINEREAQRWAANPDHCDDIRKNPLDQIHSAMRELSILGHDDIAEAAPAMLARAIGCRLQRLDGPVDDGRSVPERYADAMSSCAEFCRLAASGERYETLDPALRKAIHALESIYVERRHVDLGGASSFGEVRFAAGEDDEPWRLPWWWPFGRAKQ